MRTYSAAAWERLISVGMLLVLTASVPILIATTPWDWFFNLAYLAVWAWLLFEGLFQLVYRAQLRDGELELKSIGRTQRTTLAKIRSVQTGWRVWPTTVRFAGGRALLMPSIRGLDELVARIKLANPEARVGPLP